MAFFTDIQEQLFPTAQLSRAEKEKLRNFLVVLEDSGVGKIILEETERDMSVGGRKGYNPYRLFAAIAYAFSKHSGSLRKIEESLAFDLRFIYLMGDERPSHVTISKFLNNVVVKRYKEMFSTITMEIVRRFGIDTDDCFMDGTKIEANANKYKFVYKPTKFKIGLYDKIRETASAYVDIPDGKSQFTSKETAGYVASMLDSLVKDGVDIEKVKSGRGIRNPKNVSDYLLMSTYLLKLLDYEEKESICGPERNSYYKTDHDATAMCLKEDYYSGLGSNTHAAYNFQLIVSKGLILGFYVSQDRNDTYAMIPALERFREMHGHYPKRLCADAGYGSLRNYQFLNRNGIENYVKFPDWSRVVSGDTYNLYFFNQDGELSCLNGKKAMRTRKYGERTAHRGGYLYVIESCSYCRYKKYCQSGLKEKRSFRVFDANFDLYSIKKDVTERLLSPKGIEMRVNRSSQVEGAFGVIKQDMDYDRARRRGLESVEMEFMLVCLGYNIRKLFLLLEGKAKTDYWVAPADLKQETIPEIDYDKILRKRTKGKNETLRKSYKYKKRGC